jgi:hypothetical protein
MKLTQSGNYQDRNDINQDMVPGTTLANSNLPLTIHRAWHFPLEFQWQQGIHSWPSKFGWRQV